jgi:hypothetical protein
MVTLGEFTQIATLTFRVGYAVPYLLAAARFSRAVERIEVANVGAPFGEWWEEMRDNAVACLFLTSAPLESYVNELFSDRHKIFPDSPALLINKSWKVYERKSPFEKLNLVLELRRKPKFNKKEKEFQAMDAVIHLRNQLTHFKPEWVNEPIKHAAISDRLKGYFERNTRHFQGEGIFPRAWAGHSCTSWAVNTTLEFIEEFERLADLVGRTDRAKFNGRLNP